MRQLQGKVHGTFCLRGTCCCLGKQEEVTEPAAAPLLKVKSTHWKTGRFETGGWKFCWPPPPPQCRRSFLNCQPGPILQNKSHSHTIGEAVNHRFSNLSEVTGGRRSPRWSCVSVLPVRGEPAGNALPLPGNAGDISGLHHRTTSPPANPLPPSTALGAQNSARIITRQTLLQREHQKENSWKTTA